MSARQFGRLFGHPAQNHCGLIRNITVHFYVKRFLVRHRRCRRAITSERGWGKRRMQISHERIAPARGNSYSNDEYNRSATDFDSKFLNIGSVPGPLLDTRYVRCNVTATVTVIVFNARRPCPALNGNDNNYRLSSRLTGVPCGNEASYRAMCVNGKQCPLVNSDGRNSNKYKKPSFFFYNY